MKRTLTLIVEFDDDSKYINRSFTCQDITAYEALGVFEAEAARMRVDIIQNMRPEPDDKE